VAAALVEVEEGRLNLHVSASGFPALVLNADFRPLSYYPLSLWCWQDTIKAVFLERVNIVANYDRAVHSPSFEMKLPSVVSLKTYVKPTTQPAFTRFNVFLRDKFSCQYCGSREDLTFDHLLPRSRGGHTTWINVVAACSPCNLEKGNMTMDEGDSAFLDESTRLSARPQHRLSPHFSGASPGLSFLHTPRI
jgi:5-methylcytosine-specific restriction endonuclease McrA